MSPTPSPSTATGSDGGASTQERTGRPLLNWKFAVGVVISALLLYWVFKDIDLREVGVELAQADLPLLLLGTALATFVFWMRAWRWRALLDPVRRGTSFDSRFAAVNIGFMGNNLLPARAGEFARAFAIARLERVPIVAGLSSLVIERLLDALALVVLLFIAMAMPGLPAWPTNAEVDFPAIARGLGVTVGAIGGVLFALVLWPKPTVRLFEAVANRVLPRAVRRPVVNALEAFLAGASVLRDGRLLAEAIVWTFGLWLVNAAGFWVGFYAFGLDLSYGAAIFFGSALAFVVAIPAAPGFWGTYEFAASVTLVSLWGQEASKALGFAIGFHIASFLPVTLMGLYYATKLGISLTGVAQTEQVVEEAVERAAGQEPAG